MMIGDRIKQLRLDAKMTQPELAKKLNVTRSAVATYENNTRQPSFHVLVRLAQIFRVSTDYLLLGNDNDSLDGSGLSGDQKMILLSLIRKLRDTNEIIRSDVRLKKELATRNRELEKSVKQITQDNVE